MKKANGNAPRAEWKPPPGYQSAKAKAYAKWKESRKSQVNHLGGGDNDDEDSDSDESAFQMKCAALRTQRQTQRDL